MGVDRQFHPFAHSDPPPASAIADTTTDEGLTVPFIVRVETGYISRDQYKIAVLFDPAASWEPWAPQPQWNHKLLVLTNDGCGVDYATGVASDVTDRFALGRGFAVMATAANDASHNCNLVTEAEALVMVKEHLVESYGEIRYTIGSGCSGGAIAQLQAANAYPGIYQGLLPNCSIADAWTFATQWEDFTLLRRYLEDPRRWGAGIAWTPFQMTAVQGQPHHLNALVATTVYPPPFDPARICPGLRESAQWSPATPDKTRCTLQDFMVNVFGRRPKDEYAGRPYDNVGVQYGLEALRAGQITPAQFVDLNVNVGSHDINYVWQEARVSADREALRNAYLSGAANQANNLDSVAIIELRGPDPVFVHDAFWSRTLRARLDREVGTHANHVLWQGLMPTVGDMNYPWANDFGQAPVDHHNSALVAMDRWLAAVEVDSRAVPLAQKILQNKPADVRDQCTNGFGVVLPDLTACDAAVPVHQNPRMGAGESLTTDALACTLKPLTPKDHLPIVFSQAEWNMLRSAFPQGVCDYSRPGIHQHPTRPWQTYADGPGTGAPMGPAPVPGPKRSR